MVTKLWLMDKCIKCIPRHLSPFLIRLVDISLATDKVARLRSMHMGKMSIIFFINRSRR